MPRSGTQPLRAESTTHTHGGNSTFVAGGRIVMSVSYFHATSCETYLDQRPIQTREVMARRDCLHAPITRTYKDVSEMRGREYYVRMRTLPKPKRSVRNMFVNAPERKPYRLGG